MKLIDLIEVCKANKYVLVDIEEGEATTQVQAEPLRLESLLAKRVLNGDVRYVGTNDCIVHIIVKPDDSSD